MRKRSLSLYMAAFLVLPAIAVASSPADSWDTTDPGATAAVIGSQDLCPVASPAQDEALEPVLESCWPAECSTSSDCGDPAIWKCWAKCCVPR